MEPVSHVLRGLPVWWRDVIAEKYNWVLEDGYMERSNRRRDLHIFQVYSEDGHDRVISECQKESQLHLL